ncbi:hypothetical protein [Phenylobacterium aquaticum]|nr:hypothetical protein [Phenylobacterium aquaticum]MCI3135385.1 hypothetical protein [Phenylobacterium aquaticum]
MTGKPKTMDVSARTRLSDCARERNENAQLPMTHFVRERLLWRLSISD